ncbi:unannotated protein [freshwater metagenome]|uniref:Unannotated protein n=1 Tax=freshwater metagenome TaxID=449393 RepID=A0A6J7HJG1_9ZZZZ|nr:NAD(P)H-binding protein [Actinomycetota bacterium]
MAAFSDRTTFDPAPPAAPVLVLGATGTTGSRLVGELRRTGAVVRAASRTPRPTADPGVVPVRFSWEKRDTWTPALTGAGAVYVLPPLLSVAPEEPVLAFVAAARALGVARVVVLTGSPIAAGDPGLGRVHEALAAGPSGWTVLRPTWFAQNLVDPAHHLGAAVAAGRDLVTATGSGRVAFVDAADIAAVAARALLDERPHDTDHLITGPRALAYDEVARVLSDATGLGIRHLVVAESEAAEAMARSGMAPEYAAVLAAMETAIAAGAEDRVTDTVLRTAGRPPRDLAAVVADALGTDPPTVAPAAAEAVGANAPAGTVAR